MLSPFRGGSDMDVLAVRHAVRGSIAALVKEFDSALRAYEKKPCRDTAKYLRDIARQFNKAELLPDGHLVDLLNATDACLIPPPYNPLRAHGGLARARKLSPARRIEIAERAAKARRAKGKDT